MSYLIVSSFLLSCYIFCSEKVVTEDIPPKLEVLIAEKRRELIEVVSEVDDKLAEAFLNDEPISSSDLKVLLKNMLSRLFTFDI